ncbi:putative phage repressor [Actinobacillus ureae]|uniref:Peptidase S24-like protein n=1 Tax=Actinobacillus ureae ATCC 25976 TaxID=887324 RepID=E8KEQ6_9PAST|nr:helix-turn-helix transcriptional regulator [Actinobacillus ureae]EFX92602.1 peptidase S24-like protein [Actinobacillus ureae ATCC 25976]SUT85406.1 putative phage repressor [Actinobacillus ureae]SUU42530.1 putative phage repressor [Actinobacillus ureae]
MSTLGERIERAMESKGLKRKDLAEALNISKMAVGDLINNKTKKPRYLVEIADVLGVDVKWLQTGEGDISKHNLTLTEESDEIVFNMLNVQASASFGVNGDIVQIVRQIKYNATQYYDFYRGMNPDNVEIISVKGDSMAPTFCHGDLLFVDITIQEYDGDGIYVFTYDNYIFVKRIQKTGNTFTVLSDNKRYKDWEIKSEYHIHGKVKVHQSQQLNFIG